MHIWIDKEKLFEGIQTVSKAISSRVVNPILSGIKISADYGQVTFMGSDTDLTISYSFTLQDGTEDENAFNVIKEGEIVLLSKMIVDLVRKLPAGMVEIEEKEHGLVLIHASNIEFNVHSMDPEDYPEIPEFDRRYLFRMQSGVLQSLLKQVIIASSTSDSRPILKGMEWTLSRSSLTFISTDSHRLAKGAFPLHLDVDEEIKIIVPSKNMQELIKLLEERDEEVEITLSNTHLLLKADHLLFYSRLLEGKFPDTSMIIPKSSKTDIEISTESLKNALERAQLIAQHERNHVVRLSKSEDENIEVYTFFPELGKFSEILPVHHYEGEDLKITFNVKYLLDALRTIEEPTVILHFTGSVSPFILVPKNTDQILHLIVPVRTN